MLRPSISFVIVEAKALKALPQSLIEVHSVELNSHMRLAALFLAWAAVLRRLSAGARWRKKPYCQSEGGQPEMSRSEEHTSELQSHLNLVCRLLLEKKKNIQRWISD